MYSQIDFLFHMGCVQSGEHWFVYDSMPTYTYEKSTQQLGEDRNNRRQSFVASSIGGIVDLDTLHGRIIAVATFAGKPRTSYELPSALRFDDNLGVNGLVATPQARLN